MTALERGTAQMTGLRCSFPPYWVATRAADGEPVGALPGELYRMLERGLAPTAGEIRVTLFGMRQKLRWSRAAIAGRLPRNRQD